MAKTLQVGPNTSLITGSGSGSINPNLKRVGTIRTIARTAASVAAESISVGFFNVHGSGGPWIRLTVYGVGQKIYDGTHVQTVTTGGTSGASVPVSWNHSGSTTTDSTVTWTDTGLPIDESAEFQEACSTMAQNGGWLRIPAGVYIYLAGHSINIPSNLRLIGDGPGLCGIFGNGALATGAGMLDLNGVTAVELLDFNIEGAVLTPVGIPFSTAGDPSDNQWTQGTSIWIHTGSSNIRVQNVSINHTGGYAIYWHDDCIGLTFQDVQVTNSRPAVLTDGGLEYLGWNGGFFGANLGGTGSPTFFSDIYIIDAVFKNVTGHCFWTRSSVIPEPPVYINRNVNFSATIEDCLGDCTQPGDIDGYNEDFSARRVGFICTNGSSGAFTTPGVLVDTTPTATRVPRWSNVVGGPTAADTTGLLFNAQRTFQVDGVNGGACSGDGMANSAIYDCVCTSAFYSTDTLINKSLCGPAGSIGINYCSGIITSNSNGIAEVGQNLLIDGCELNGFGYLSIGGFSMTFSTISNCTIRMPIVGSPPSPPPGSQAGPIVLGNITVSGTVWRSYSNKVFGCHVDWPASGGFAVAEDASMGAFQPGDSNQVDSSNTYTCTGLLFKNIVTCSTTGILISSSVTPTAKWAHAQYIVGQTILDPNNHIQYVFSISGSGGTLGLTGTLIPSSWNALGGHTTDGNVIWLDLGLAVVGLPSGTQIQTEGQLASLADHAYKAYRSDGVQMMAVTANVALFGRGTSGDVSYTVSGALWSGGFATFTIGAHLIPIGGYITVLGATPVGYNVISALVTAISSTYVTVTMVSNPGTYVSGGTLSLTSTGGFIATGSRSTSDIGDVVASGVFYADGFISTPSTRSYDYTAKESAFFSAGANYGLRGNASGWEQCLSAPGGVPVWTALGGNTNYTALGEYDWSFTVGSGVTGSLGTAGLNSITFTTVPPGVITGSMVFINGGTGTPEFVFVTMSGSTASFTSVNSHTGSWAVSSNTRGLQEQLNLGVTNNYPFIILGRSSATPSPQQIDAAMLIMRSTNDSNATNAENRATLSVYTEYGATNGTCAGVISEVLVSNNTIGNDGDTCFYGTIYADATSIGECIAQHGEAHALGANTSVTFNAEGDSVQGVHIGYECNTGQSVTWTGPFTISSASWSGGYATYNAIGHNLVANGYVYITGVSPAGYNVRRALVHSVTSSQVVIAMSVNPGAGGSGGTLQGNPVYIGGNFTINHPSYNDGGAGFNLFATTGTHPYGLHIYDSFFGLIPGSFTQALAIDSNTADNTSVSCIRLTATNNGVFDIPTSIDWYRAATHIAQMAAHVLTGSPFSATQLTFGVAVNTGGAAFQTLLQLDQNAVSAPAGYMQAAKGFYCDVPEYGLHVNDGTSSGGKNGYVFQHASDHNLYVISDASVNLVAASGSFVLIGSSASTTHLEPYTDNVANLGGASNKWANIYAVNVTATGTLSAGTFSPSTMIVGSPFFGTANSSLFSTNAGTLASTLAADLLLASIGCLTTNETHLGIHAYRNSIGTQWTSTSLVLSVDVDNSPYAGAFITLQGGVGGVGLPYVGINTFEPNAPLDVAGTNGTVTINAFNGYIQSLQGFFCQTGDHGLHVYDGNKNGYVYIHAADHNLYMIADQNLYLQPMSGGFGVFGAGGGETLEPFSNNTASLGSSSVRWSNVYAVDINASGTFTAGTFSPSTMTVGSGLSGSTRSSLFVTEYGTVLSSAHGTDMIIASFGYPVSPVPDCGYLNIHAYRSTVDGYNYSNTAMVLSVDFDSVAAYTAGPFITMQAGQSTSAFSLCVGINTLTPLATLDVNGTIGVSGTTVINTSKEWVGHGIDMSGSSGYGINIADQGLICNSITLGSSAYPMSSNLNSVWSTTPILPGGSGLTNTYMGTGRIAYLASVGVTEYMYFYNGFFMGVASS